MADFYFSSYATPSSGVESGRLAMDGLMLLGGLGLGMLVVPFLVTTLAAGDTKKAKGDHGAKKKEMAKAPGEQPKGKTHAKTSSKGKGHEPPKAFSGKTPGHSKGAAGPPGKTPGHPKGAAGPPGKAPGPPKAGAGPAKATPGPPKAAATGAPPARRPAGPPKPKVEKKSTISQTILTTFKPPWLEMEYELRTQGTQMWAGEVVLTRTCRERTIREKVAAPPPPVEAPPPPVEAPPPPVVPPPPSPVESTQDEMTDVTQEVSAYKKPTAPKPEPVPVAPKSGTKKIVDIDPLTGKKRVKVSDGNLLADPGIVNWSVKGGMQKLKLHNVSGKRQAIKVKCSDNGMFRVNPVLAFVEQDADIELDIFRATGNAKEDELMIMNTPALANQTNAAALFKTSAASSNLIVAQTFKE